MGPQVLRGSQTNIPLPSFPVFESLELGHQTAVEALVTHTKPYSDFNFTNLFIWNIDGSTMVSQLNKNLVVRIMNYTGEHLVLTLDGTNEIDETVDILLKYAESQPDLNNTLEYVHEDVAVQLGPNYIVTEEPHNFDYIIKLSNETNLSGRKNKSRRKLIRRFEDKHEKTCSVKLLDISQTETQKQILELFDRWASAKTLPQSDIDDERMALERLFLLTNANLQITALYDRKHLIGFTVDELGMNKCAIGHFMKADTAYTGIFQYLEYQSALNLIQSNMNYLNIEQDLGIEELRLAKANHRPHELLRKFSISLPEMN